MLAMQIIEWGKPLETREYPDPEPKGEEVLLRVEAAKVCHSDVHICDGRNSKPPPSPIAPCRGWRSV
jgi:propanol-preferring alcohol dehydrogenase